jgi:hypothetical protein
MPSVFQGIRPIQRLSRCWPCQLGNLARIMFIADPDGIINEFVGLPK